MADEKGVVRDFNDLWCERVELVDCLDTFDLGKQPVNEVEVA